jgi:hypothetical protein
LILGFGRLLPACVAAAGAALLLSPPVRAFERQWHVGASLAGVQPSDSLSRGVGVGAYAAYGLSDMFDVRAELRSSFHGKTSSVPAFDLHFGWLGLAYKLDVLEWIPSFGVRAGFYEQNAESVEWARRGGTIGGFAGLDHAFSRSFAAGLEIAVDRLLPEGSTSSLALRAEYRWGY